jgi:hypothetical protein
MKKHTHKYFRDDIGIKKSYIVYRCAVPDCYHYIPENQIIGRKSICFRCGDEFVVSHLLAKQTCPNCDSVRGNPNWKRDKPSIEVDLDRLRELMEDGEN